MTASLADDRANGVSPEPAATTVPEPAATTVPEPAVTTVPEPAATTVPEPAAAPVRPAGPVPTSWEKWAWIGFALAMAYLLTCVGRLVFTLQETSTLVSIVDNPALDPDGSTVANLSSVESTFSTVLMLTSFAYLGGYILFLRKVRGLGAEEGMDMRPLLKHWSFLAWRLCVLVSLVATFARPSAHFTAPDQAGLHSQIQNYGDLSSLLLGVRMLTAGVMAFAIVSLRTRIRAALLARTAVAGLHPAQPSLPAQQGSPA
ncbi:hypothetical protein GCM10009760_62850 [Kitasatospora kazusensis]|uniref:DUF4328 domain-containing protein n=1 Tax=Kitasatospora kazusensis TaxID=407974 RepID=A0ABP4KBY6_9ACTN